MSKATSGRKGLFQLTAVVLHEGKSVQELKRQAQFVAKALVATLSYLSAFESVSVPYIGVLFLDYSVPLSV